MVLVSILRSQSSERLRNPPKAISSACETSMIQIQVSLTRRHVLFQLLSSAPTSSAALVQVLESCLLFFTHLLGALEGP